MMWCSYYQICLSRSRAVSSVGIACDWRSRGHWFDPGCLRVFYNSSFIYSNNRGDIVLLKPRGIWKGACKVSKKKKRGRQSFQYSNISGGFRRQVDTTCNPYDIRIAAIYYPMKLLLFKSQDHHMFVNIAPSEQQEMISLNGLVRLGDSIFLL